MVSSPNKLSRFWHELKRRNVTRVLAVYIAAAFMILELISMFSDSLGLPERTLLVAFFISIAGLLIAVIVSWIYDIQPEGGIVKTEPAQNVKADVATKSAISWKIASYISFVVIVGLIVLNVITRSENKTVLEKSIAVLPLINLSNSDEISSMGFTDEIITKLQNIKAFDRVLSLTSTMQFADQRPTISEIGEILNVNYLVEGTLQKKNDEISINIRVIIAKEDDHIWAKEFDESWENRFLIQDEIALAVANELHMVLSPSEIERIEHVPTTSLNAHHYFQRAREEHTRYWLDEENDIAINNAISLYKSALDMDSSFAQAYTGLALAISNTYYSDRDKTMVFSEVERQRFQDSVLSLVDKAMLHDKQLEEAFYVKARYYFGIQNYDQAIDELDKAIAINPNYSEAYNIKSWILLNQRGDWIEGLKSILKAVELEKGPLLIYQLRDLGVFYEVTGFQHKSSDIYQEILNLTRDTASYIEDMAGVAFCDRDWEARKNWCLRGLELDSTWAWFYEQVSGAYLALDNIDSAFHYAVKLHKLIQSGVIKGNINWIVGEVYWAKGRYEEANEILDPMVTYLADLLDSKTGWNEWNYIILGNLLALRGQGDRAMHYLKKFDLQKPVQSWIISLLESPSFRDLHSDPEFQEILSQLKTRWQEEHDKLRIWMEENNVL
jgi:TolB-like protein